MGTRDRPDPAASIAASRRKLNPMPGQVQEALDAHHLRAAYEARPALQRNDYLGWIARARSAETRDQRLQQMLDELERGDCFMSMAWRPRRPTS